LDPWTQTRRFVLLVYGPSKPAFWREHPDKKRESPHLAWIVTTSHKIWICGPRREGLCSSCMDPANPLGVTGPSSLNLLILPGLRRPLRKQSKGQWDPFSKNLGPLNPDRQNCFCCCRAWTQLFVCLSLFVCPRRESLGTILVQRKIN